MKVAMEKLDVSSRKRQMGHLISRDAAQSELSDNLKDTMGSIFMISLLIGLLSACAPPQTPSPTVAVVPTATPGPKPVGGIDSNAAPDTDRHAANTTASRVAESFNEGGVHRAYFLNRYVIVTGTAVRVDVLKNRGRQSVMLEGTSGTSVLCERPRGFVSRELSEPLPSDGLPVIVAGRVSESRSEEDIVIVDCHVLKTGREVTPRSVAKIPAITNVFHGWGLFWAWTLVAGLGYLLAFRRRRVTSGWLLIVFVLAHTGGVSSLYAFLGSLVLPYYDASGVSSLATWPFILTLNPS